MKRLVVFMVLIVGIIVPGSTLTAVASDRVTVLLDWFVNPDHAPLFVALEKGFFNRHGLTVEFIAPSNPNDPPKLVAAKKIDMAVSYQPQHHFHVDRGLPLVRIATLVGTLNDIRLVNVNFSLSPSLLSGKTDAVIGAFRNFELNQMDIENRPGRAFYVEEHGIPSYDELILICHRDQLKNKKYRAFVDALEQGVQYLINHPEESWRLFIRGRKELDDELNRRAWRDTLPRFALRPGALDRARYLRFADFLKKQGVIKTVPPLGTWAVELPVK